MQYDRRSANGLVPLLDAIGKEIRERGDRLEELEARLETLASRPAPDEREVQRLVAEAAAHRRGIRLSKQELERLGCSVVGTAPLTFRIPGREGPAKHSFVWRTGDPVLR